MLHFTVVILECEENICKNGGSCSVHVGDYRCDCPAGFSGFLCEGIISHPRLHHSSKTMSICSEYMMCTNRKEVSGM